LQVCANYSPGAPIANIISLLVKHSYDVNTPNNNNDTPLITAIRVSNASMVNALLEAKADMNYRDLSNNTVLQIWAQFATESILTPLLKE